MGRSFATFSKYTLVGPLKWIMRVLNSQGSRLWRLHHPLVIYVRKSGSLRIWRLQRSWCLPPRQEQSQPANRLLRVTRRSTGCPKVNCLLLISRCRTHGACYAI